MLFHIYQLNMVQDQSSPREMYFQITVSEDVIQAISYDLAASVCYIDYPHQHERKNLVALISVGPHYHDRTTGSPINQWYIFNDFR